MLKNVHTQITLILKGIIKTLFVHLSTPTQYALVVKDLISWYFPTHDS